MKKINFLAFLFCYFSLYAQNQKMTVFGFKGGYNKSILKGNELDGSKTGYIGYELYGGFFSDTSLNKNLSFEQELLFSYTDDYHFIEFPFHLKHKVFTKGTVFIGPKLDFIADNDNDYFESRYKFKNFGISADFGTQYNFSKRFFVEIRYSKSFTEQVDDLDLDIYGGKRNTFRVGLGVKF